jgi:4-hydroxy-tetrahydrodipicolinate reductase
MSTRVAIVGASGRLGALAARTVEADPQFELVARIERGMDLEASLHNSRATLALDATAAGLGFEHGQRLLRAGVRPVIGTSGVQPAEVDSLDRLARELSLGGLVVPNFALGMVLLQRAALEAARHFADFELIEMHHERKKDAPSGTAANLARRMQALREDPKRPVPIHSVRLPGLYAHQLVIFGGAGETYTLRHDMAGPEGFAPGIRAALRYARGAQGVLVGLEHALAER